MIQEDSIVQAQTGLTVAALSGEAVILDSASGRYFGLNEVGARIFELAQEPVQIGDILKVVSSEFDISRERLEADVDNFLSDMVHHRLVRVDAGVKN